MFQVGTKRKRRANDIIGVVVLEVEGADDLPAWPNGMLFCRFWVIFISGGGSHILLCSSSRITVTCLLLPRLVF